SPSLRKDLLLQGRDEERAFTGPNKELAVKEGRKRLCGGEQRASSRPNYKRYGQCRFCIVSFLSSRAWYYSAMFGDTTMNGHIDRYFSLLQAQLDASPDDWPERFIFPEPREGLERQAFEQFLAKVREARLP